MSFEQWCTRWESVPLSEAAERYDICKASDNHVEDLEELFGDEPECFFVHQGDLTIDGPLSIGNDPGLAPDTVYVIDGDLTVNGPMRFLNADVYTPLYVTGSVTAQHLMCLMDSNLFIGGSLTVGGLLMTELSDMGVIVVNGAASAGAWLETWDRGEVIFVDDLKARRLRLSGGDYLEHFDADDAAGILLPEFLDGDAEDASEKLWKAALEGRPLLRPWLPAGSIGIVAWGIPAQSPFDSVWSVDHGFPSRFLLGALRLWLHRERKRSARGGDHLREYRNLLGARRRGAAAAARATRPRREHCHRCPTVPAQRGFAEAVAAVSPTTAAAAIKLAAPQPIR
ncbi:hypothetical protein ACFXPS_41310 [Nocardia sp. NPDC059091]|uniref:hypothetical protein n=2 Tax=unclassified Nocardia TaxID=2637762 RepID=UPI00368F571D